MVTEVMEITWKLKKIDRREFHNEKYYAAPDINILADGLNKTADNIGAMFRAIGENQRAQKKAGDQYKRTSYRPKWRIINRQGNILIRQLIEPVLQ